MRLKSRGFTLVETMLSVAILLVVVIAAFLAVTNSIFLNESSRNLVTASNDAQHVLEQIKVKSFNDIPGYVAGYPSSGFSNLPQETVSFPNPVYTSNLITITVQINWNERNVARTFSITTRFAQ